MAKRSRTIAENVFLAQLVGLPVIGIMALVAALIVGQSICTTPTNTCGPDYWPVLYALVTTSIVAIPLALYIRGKEKLAVRISQLLWLIPAVISVFSLIALIIGLGLYSYTYFTDNIITGLSYLITITIFGAITKSYKEFQRQRPPTTHHLIIKGIFVTQLAFITWLAASSAFGGWFCATQQECDLNQLTFYYDATNLASIGLLVVAGTGLIAWLRNQRLFSILIAQLSLVALTLYIALFYLTFSYQLLDYYRGQPAIGILSVAFSLTPLALLVFIHHYKQQILED